MKKIIVAIATLLPILLWNCSNEPEAPAPPSLKMRLLDSVVINKISRQLNTTSDEYPVPWNPADKSTWREIQLDTVYDEDQGQCLAVGAITLYITKGNGNPYELRWLSDLKELYIFGCTDSYFYGEYIPSNVNTLVIDRLNPDDPGFIKVINDDLYLDEERKPEKNVRFPRGVLFKKIVIHGLDMNNIELRSHLDSDIDLSGNQLNGDVPSWFHIMSKSANLNHNNFSGLEGDWDSWVNKSTIPNLQYNNIEIPAEILETEFWKMHGHKFIGNPGYAAHEQEP